MRGLTWLAVSIIGLVLALIGVACAPRVTPSPLTPPAPQTAPPPAGAAPTTPLSETSAGDVALARLVESAQKEGTVNVYSVSWTGDIGLEMTRAFKNRYGIKMEIITGKGAEFIERIKTEQRIGQTVADFQEGSSSSMTKVKMEGLSQPVLDLPVLQERDVWTINPLVMDKEGFSIGYYFTENNPWVNTKLVSASEMPRSFQDWLKPQWKGKMVVADPTINSAPNYVLVTLVNNKALDWETVRALGRQELKYARTTAEMFRMSLARGEAHLTPLGSSLEGLKTLKEGVPIKPIALEEGTVVSVGGAVMVKNAPHPNAVRLLLNWVISQEGQSVLMKAMGNASIRKDGGDFRHPDGRVQPKKLFVEMPQDSEEAAVKMRDRFLPNLWKQ